MATLLGESLTFMGDFVAKKGKGAVELIALVCTETGLRNYTTKKNRRNIQGKIELMKFCPRLRKHTLHREGKIK